MISEQKMYNFEDFRKIVARLRAEDGCPWDREQTIMSMRPCCIEEAAEVVCGADIYDETGDPSNLREELGDLLFQVLMNSQIAEDEGLFTLDDVIDGIAAKMVSRHPHVFGDEKAADSAAVIARWNELKKSEKTGKEWQKEYLPRAFSESVEFIDKARERKGLK